VVVILFSHEHKARRVDLFDRERELEEIDQMVRHNKLVLVTGIRRVGKTLFINIFCHDVKIKTFYHP